MLYHVAWLILQPFRLIFKLRGNKCYRQFCKEEPYIIIANHESPKDPWKIGPHVPRVVYWFCKRELYSFKDSYKEAVEAYGHSP
ncbi:MAG: hypothetical protein ABFQ53_01880, partial [Patescibacteria group bacterium]